MWSTPAPPVLGSLLLVKGAANASPDNAWMWAVVPFLALVAVFLIYQQRQSSWTWREFAEGMSALLFKAVVFGVTLVAKHPYIPPDD
ncbi:MAG: hypothetical protein ABSA70_15540 [Terriglobia bacterium]